MATFKSIKAFDQALANLERERKERATRDAMSIAEDARKIAIQEASSNLGGDSRFSGWDDGGRDLADLNVKRLRGQRTGAILHPSRKSGGPWKVAEIGRNQGNVLGRGGTDIFLGPGINRKTGQTSRTKTGRVSVRRFRSKRWNGYTQGFGTASRAVKQFDEVAEKGYQQGLRKTLVRRFDVKGF